MGMDQKVVFPREKSPPWPALVQCLAAKNVRIEMRMIDGQLAFPDETPPEDWKELRVGTPAGMITMRREADGITLVIWGNADEKLRTVWEQITEAIGELTR